MNIEQELLSEITIHLKYAKYLPEKQRRETWEEIVTRNKEMHLRKFPQLKEEIESAYKLVYEKKILPSMRSIQFAGKVAEINNARIFNCCYLPVDDYRAFSETLFLLLTGCGVGYSVQNHHIEDLPEIRKPLKPKRYLIGDSIEGWADAVKALCKAYFGKTITYPVFDYRDIREKGAALLTTGGKAPGPEPLKIALTHIEVIFNRKKDGDKLTSLECHDIMCHLADAVLGGGIRRAALISGFDLTDEDMLTCKFGNWWEENPQRGRANNTAVLLKSKINKETFLDLWKKIELSNSGEPGFMFTDNNNYFTNPCAEIALKPKQFCNLCEINASNIESQEDLNNRTRAAAFIGSLQASYTDFHYLREDWKKITEKEALLGIGMTGIASGNVLKLNMEEAAKIAVEENERVSNIIGTNKAARITTVKPSGTTSLVLGTSSGIHAWHSEYYIRRIRLGKNEALYSYLKENHPELLEDDFFKPQTQAIVSVPQKAPEGAITRKESAFDLLERIKRLNKEWILPGHRRGGNTHNVSATVTIKPEEWENVGTWLYNNKNYFTALSFLPYSDHSYTQPPFEDISKEKFEELVSHLHEIDLSRVKEITDETNLVDQQACLSGACEIV